MKRRCKCLLAALLCWAAGAGAQTFKVSAALDAVPATGFYRIPVNAELSAWARADHADVRIAAEEGYVPYIVRNLQQFDEPEVESSGELKLLDGSDSLIVLQKGADRMTYGISLTMNTTAVERYAQISGSNDGKHWYIIDDHILLHMADGYSRGTYAQYINFPGNKYAYYKLKIDNAHTDPLHVVAAKAFYDQTKLQVRPVTQENPPPVVRQKDSSNHITYVAIRNSLPYMLNGLTLQIAGPKYYERNARIYIMATDADSSALSNAVTSVVLSSARPSVFTLAAQKARVIVLEIDNKDDQPLRITGAATRQQTQELVAWLEQAKKYTLLAGNELVPAPEYDLSRFADSIKPPVPQLGYGGFQPTMQAIKHAATQPETHGYWLWIIIVVSIVVLSLLTYRLIKDVKKEGI